MKKSVGKKFLPKGRVIAVCAGVLSCVAAVTGVVAVSNINASSEPNYSPEKQALLDEKAEIYENYMNDKKTKSVTEYPTLSPEEMAEDLAAIKEESDRIDAEVAKRQVVVDTVSEKTGVKELLAADKNYDRLVLALIDYLTNYELTDEEYEEAENLLYFYAIGYKKESEIGQKINDTIGYFDELEEIERKIASSQLDD